MRIILLADGGGALFVTQSVFVVENIMSLLGLQKRRVMRTILLPNQMEWAPNPQNPPNPVGFLAFYARRKEHDVMTMFAGREINAGSFFCKWRMDRLHILIKHQALAWNVLTFLFKNHALVWSSLTLLFSKSSSRVGHPHILLQNQAPVWSILALLFRNQAFAWSVLTF